MLLEITDRENLLIKGLRRSPSLQSDVIELANLISNSTDIADAIEDKLADIIRKTGLHVLEEWALKQSSLSTADKDIYVKECKKNTLAYNLWSSRGIRTAVSSSC